MLMILRQILDLISCGVLFCFVGGALLLRDLRTSGCTVSLGTSESGLDRLLLNVFRTWSKMFLCNGLMFVLKGLLFRCLMAPSSSGCMSVRPPVSPSATSSWRSFTARSCLRISCPGVFDYVTILPDSIGMAECKARQLFLVAVRIMTL